ncbi:GNAT family N-acetyltransferase [Roseinatronobacter alkalisoli]|uniref:GNAT family N-acetyltransferase n=1 Tax=Roseinatronobacter alkalisoli TaxID=3028235 RepID=A0ABT5TAA1_9RHOB|nr:GNAT family N-acetyltransferase [Roseinatronobacter sp. HJB301]MDD7972038.1 GNAT family N-acetyltransferase [Roseinatronobacter sp. HJB301]
MLTATPQLQTERLILRAPCAQDFPVFAAYFMSERAQFTGGQPDRILAWNRFCVTLGHWVMRGYGVFAIVRRDTGAVIGAAGPFFPEGWPEPEIAWQLWDGHAEGNGFAYEAALATRTHVYADLGWKTAVSLIAPENQRSAALAQRLGCTLEGAHPHPHFGPLDIWRHPAS